MAFDHVFVALDLREGVYSVAAAQSFNSGTEIDWPALVKAHPLVNIAESVYQDHATVLSPAQLRAFAIGPKALAFLDGEARDAFLFLVHRGEWESGL